MAIFRAYDEVNVALLGYENYTIVYADVDKIIIDFPDYQQHILGVFIYSQGKLQGGILDGTEFYKNGKLLYALELGAFDADASTLGELISSEAIYAVVGSFLQGDDTIHGSDQNDVLTGYLGDDTLYGNAGDDVFVDLFGNDDFYGGSGDDFFIATGGRIFGGPGVDTAAVFGLPSQYTYTNSQLTMLTNKDVYFDSVEKLHFGDITTPEFSYIIDLEDLSDPDGSGTQVSSVTQQLTKLSDLYIAYFGRAPDVEGLNYWFKEIYTGSLSFDQVAHSFSQQAEYQKNYSEGSTNTDFITAIYQNMFNRAPDQAGLTYWKGELDGGMARDNFILTVINGAYSATGGAEDKALLNNKHDVSLYYAEQSSLNPNESFDNGINSLLNAVTSNSGTVGVAQEIINYAFAEDEITLTGIINDQSLWASFWAG